ncbi:MAG: glycosyl transferase, partial [Acidobacteriaceae bacterium]|nr:glycosyl transferase [Acidobacteriaceae bacterium]
AAALRKPGVALFGLTDPARTGPYGGSLTVLRSQNVPTTYKRHDAIHPSMTGITVEEVTSALLQAIASARVSGYSVETVHRS